MEAFWLSTGLVALAEIGDKTQLLAFVLAARYRKTWPIVLGILAATLVNHALAAGLGAWISSWAQPQHLRWGLGLGFVAMGAWLLVPDTLDDEDTAVRSRWGVFGTTFVAFFFAEMGDKTQVATVAMAAQFQSLAWVLAGTTAGMMLANVPAVLLGDRLAGRIPVRWVHGTAAVIFVLLGVLVLSGQAARWGL